MNSDRLNETYVMLNSNLHFEHFGWTNLTSRRNRSDQSTAGSATWSITGRTATDQTRWSYFINQICYY
jgi:hypothetical protein